jgi:SAM-dependent methyltransferase
MTTPAAPPPDDQIAYWNGPAGSRWATGQEELDRMLAPFGAALLRHARPAPGERVVEIGCGCGGTTLDLAAAVGPGGRVTALDVSAPMLARARERAAGLGTVTFVEADAATHRQAEPADLLVSRFGVMFFADPAAAFQNLAVLLRPGGRMVFACWRTPGENPWATVPFEAARAALALQVEPPGAPGPGPFAFADPALVRGLLQGAGLEGIAVEAFDSPVVIGGGLDEAVRFSMALGPTARLVAGVDDAARARAAAALREALAPHASGGPVTMAAAVWLVSARRPA